MKQLISIFILALSVFFSPDLLALPGVCTQAVVSHVHIGANWPVIHDNNSKIIYADLAGDVQNSWGDDYSSRSLAIEAHNPVAPYFYAAILESYKKQVPFHFCALGTLTTQVQNNDTAWRVNRITQP